MPLWEPYYSGESSVADHYNFLCTTHSLHHSSTLNTHMSEICNNHIQLMVSECIVNFKIIIFLSFRIEKRYFTHTCLNFGQILSKYVCKICNNLVYSAFF